VGRAGLFSAVDAPDEASVKVDSRFISICTGPGPVLVWLLRIATGVGVGAAAAAEPVLVVEVADSLRSSFAARRSRRDGRSRCLRGDSGGRAGSAAGAAAVEELAAADGPGAVGALVTGVVVVGVLGADSEVEAAFPRVRLPPPSPRSR
jgi:hypothetical protein